MTTLAFALRARTFRSLRRHRNYRIFFTGQLVSLAGTWMQNVALAWLVIELSGSPLAIGHLERFVADGVSVDAQVKTAAPVQLECDPAAVVLRHIEVGELTSGSGAGTWPI